MTLPISQRGHQGRAEYSDQEPASDEASNGEAGEPGAVGLRRYTARFRRPAPALQGLIALAIYLGVWVIGWTLPVLQNPHLTMFAQSSMDPNFYVWSLRWWPYAIAHGLNPLMSTQIGAPSGFNLTWTTTVPPLALLASPLTLLAGAVQSFNILTVIAPAVSGWAAFVACRRLTGRFWASLIGGAFYGFSSYETGHTVAGQLNLTWTLLLPLMVYLIVLWRDQKIGRTWFVSLMALAILLQFFLFLETFFELTVILAIGLPVGYAIAGSAGRPAVARLARQLTAAWVIALVLASPYLIYALAHYPKGFSRSPAITGLNLASIVVPRPTGGLGISWLVSFASRLPLSSQAGYLGLPVVLIALALAIRTWHSKTTRFLTVMMVVIVALAIGPVLVIGTQRVGSVPWSKLWFLPVAKSALPNRFMLIGSLAAAVIVAVWLARPVRSRISQAARLALAVVAAAALFLNVPSLTFDPASVRDHIPGFFASGKYTRYIKPGETVLVISQRGNAAMLFQADTNFYMRVAGGFINMALTPRTDLPTDVIALAHADPTAEARFIAYLKAANIKAVIVERDWEPRWSGLLHKLGLEGKPIRGVIFYPIGRCVTSCHPAGHPHHHHHAGVRPA
jgi:hypothetical protein